MAWARGLRRRGGREVAYNKGYNPIFMTIITTYGGVHNFNDNIYALHYLPPDYLTKRPTMQAPGTIGHPYVKLAWDL